MTAIQSRLMRYIMILSFPGLAWGSSLLDSKALNQQLKAYQGIKQLRAEFVQTKLIKKWQASIKTQGSLHFEKLTPHNKILWEIIQPEYSAIRITGDELQIKSGGKASKKWKSFKGKQWQQQLSPLLSWLSFDSDKISQHYQVFLIGKQNFLMKPKAEGSSLKSIQIEGKPSGIIKSVELTELTDDTIKIEFKNVKLEK